jgi:hypothetical protein
MMIEFKFYCFFISLVTYVLRYQAGTVNPLKPQSSSRTSLKKTFDTGPGHIPRYNWNTISETAVVNELAGSVLEMPVVDTPNTFNKVDTVAVIQ